MTTTPERERKVLAGVDLSSDLMRARARQDRAEFDRLLAEADATVSMNAAARLTNTIWQIAMALACDDEERAKTALLEWADDEEDAIAARLYILGRDLEREV